MTGEESQADQLRAVQRRAELRRAELRRTQPATSAPTASTAPAVTATSRLPGPTAIRRGQTVTLRHTGETGTVFRVMEDGRIVVAYAGGGHGTWHRADLTVHDEG
jgi:hypothetical protein